MINRSQVIEKISKSRFNNTTSNLGVAYFYFSYKIVSPILGVTLALMEQLYLQAYTVPSEVEELERISDSSEVTLSNAVSVLMALAGRFRRCYFILDALDECASEFHGELTVLLTAIVNSNCRLFVTSRHSLYLPLMEQAAKIEIVSSAEDIERYVRHKISDDSTLSKRVGEHIEEIVGRLVKSSEGM
jgi:hypothetical protein